MPAVKSSIRLAPLLAAILAHPAALADLPTGLGWHALPNTQLRRVCAAENGFPAVLGALGCVGITRAWSGGVFDSKRNRMIVWGGGHNDYYGNEIYALNLSDQTIERLTNPGLPIAPGAPCLEGIIGNTQANSRHTYDGIEYMPNVDRMFVFGGSLACLVGNFGSDTWTFSFATKTWQRMNPAGTVPRGDAGMMTAYDPNTGLIFLHDRRNLFSYDFAANRYTQLTSSGTDLGYHLAATIDPKRKKFVIAGFDGVAGGGRVWTFSIAAGSTYAIERGPETGGGGLIGEIYPGLEYDPATDRIVAWGEGSPNVVYSLNLDTRQWTSTSYAGGPRPVTNGTHGRWRYSVSSNVFVLVNSVDDNIFILRHSATAAVRPNPPTDVAAQ